MNGRIYDPLLGRFLSADTFVQDAGDLQAYNRYSYVRNNPSSLNDPSGHFWSAVITAGFAAYDTYQYATGKISGGEYAKNMALNGAALVADVATLGNGGGLAVRAANIAIRTAKVIDKANDVYETAQGVVAAVEATSELASKVVEGNATLADVGNAALAVGGSALDAAGGGKGPDLPTEKMHVSKLDGADIVPGSGHGRVDTVTAPATQANIHDAPKVAFGSAPEAPSSRKLKENMEAAGRPVGKDEAAHHIVAGTDKRAAESRELLNEAGIPINSEVNGAALPKNTQSPNPDGKTVHSTMHTNEYHDGVTETLRNTAPEDRAAALRAIADELEKKKRQ